MTTVEAGFMTALTLAVSIFGFATIVYALREMFRQAGHQGRSNTDRS